MTRLTARAPAAIVACLLSAAALVAGNGGGQDKAPVRREWTVTASHCSFSPARIDATRGDIVRITLVAEDGPHSFVIDGYRIARRATPGARQTFEFLADRQGTFPFYSDLTSDRGCRDMRGALIVS